MLRVFVECAEQLQSRSYHCALCFLAGCECTCRVSWAIAIHVENVFVAHCKVQNEPTAQHAH